MKIKKFKNGKSLCHTYLKKVGNNYEVGFKVGSKLLFLGNFIHNSEALKWYTKMNHDIRNFGKRYPVGRTYPSSFFQHFIASHLYKAYYSFLNKQIPTRARKFQSALNQDLRKYKRIKQSWLPQDKKPYLKAA